jgi:hypothetical protein
MLNERSHILYNSIYMKFTTTFQYKGHSWLEPEGGRYVFWHSRATDNFLGKENFTYLDYSGDNTVMNFYKTHQIISLKWAK